MNPPKPKKLNHKWQERSVHSNFDQTSIRYALYRKNPDIPIKRCVIFFNGRSEWIEKNMEIPDDLNLPDDCGFLTIDHRGQGMSGGRRASVDSYDVFVSDVQSVLKAALPANLPHVVAAHSMGCLISIWAIMKGVLKPQRAVFCAPMLRLGTPLQRFLMRPVSKVLASMKLDLLRTGAGSFESGKFADNEITHDYHMYQISQHSPYQVPSPDFRWLAQSLRAFDEVFAPDNLAKYKVPTLVLSPSEETVVDPSGGSDFIRALEEKGVLAQYKVIHGARHELFSEIAPYREQAIAEIKYWFADFLMGV